MEAVFFFQFNESETERYASQVLTLTLTLTATLVWYIISRQPGCSRDTENKDILCTYLSNHLKISTDQPFVHPVVNDRQ